MRVLLIGATGWLGGHVATALGALPAARLLTAGRTGTDVPLDLATVGAADLRAAADELRPDVVINCAGAVSGEDAALVAVDAHGAAVLCAGLRRTRHRARLVHLGSSAEYGPGTAGGSLTEAAAPRPLGAYGVSKLAGSLAVAAADLDAVVLRVFNAVGPGAAAGSLPGRLAAELRGALRSGTAGDGGVVRVGPMAGHRDFVDVRDVARAVVTAAAAPAGLPRIINIGSGRARPVRAIAEGLVQASGFTGTISETGPGSIRSAALSWQQADVSRAGRALGWRPEIPLAQSLADLWSSVAAGPRE
ncbi:NAD-dependent epimerase/dehydratase family protein [Kitasatospora sp. NPDC088346]|uniref:NAD-dependent epimerase/dehydratase family protein n=1 Tax=Kitasatospora sp. NPDC088346 TaxID=3364073 RepID=UPI003813EB0F